MAVDPLAPSPLHTPLSVLVIDAHPAVRLGLERLVGIMPGFRVCGLAGRSDDGLACAALVRPDVVLVDAELPGDAAVATIRQLRACLPAARVVALALYADHRAAMLAAGAHAFVLKDAGFEALRAAMVPERATETTSGAACESASARTPWSART
jgi:DNA-binding NarL/FixJ family response regulator